MPKRSHSALAVALSAAVLCGCGGAAENAQPTRAPSAAAAVKDKKHQFESAKADCMKKQGFKYIPYVRQDEPTEEDRKVESGDYEAMKRHRQKYGFGIFAIHVYPKEMGAPETMGGGPIQDPNDKVQEGLSDAQLASYQKAENGCVVETSKQVLGVTVKSKIDYYSSMVLAQRKLTASRLDGDPELVNLAGTMATCLTGKGYTIGNTKPTAMAVRGMDTFQVEQDKVGRKQDDSVPDVAPPKNKNGGMAMNMPTLSPQEAKPYLDKEIKAALDDLECGKDFYAAYEPRNAAIRQQINDQYAF